MNHKIYVFFAFILMFFGINIIYSKTLPLKNKIIVIDPGHGGIDKGANYYSYYESNLVLNISKTLKKELEKKGALVYLTRNGNYDLSNPGARRRKKSDFDNRISYIKNINPDVVLSIHLNASRNENYNGMQLFYKNSEKLSKILYKELNIRRKIVKRTDIYLLNNINCETVLIEWGFISNYSDLLKIKNEKEIKKTSNLIAIGLSKFLT